MFTVFQPLCESPDLRHQTPCQGGREKRQRRRCCPVPAVERPLISRQLKLLFHHRPFNRDVIAHIGTGRADAFKDDVEFFYLVAHGCGFLKRRVIGGQAEFNAAVIGTGGIEAEGNMGGNRVRFAELALQMTFGIQATCTAGREQQIDSFRA